MNNAWDQVKLLIEQHDNQGGIFVRLTNNGDKIVGAFCGEPFPREVVWTGDRHEDFDPDVHTDGQPDLRVMLNFFVPAESAMKVIEGGMVWFKDVLRVRDKYGLDRGFFEIERHGGASDDVEALAFAVREEVREAVNPAKKVVLAVKCPACGSGVGRECYGNGPMVKPHEVRARLATENALVDLITTRQRELKEEG